jgi:hypothetical protein
MAERVEAEVEQSCGHTKVQRSENNNSHVSDASVDSVEIDLSAQLSDRLTRE